LHKYYAQYNGKVYYAITVQFEVTCYHFSLSYRCLHFLSSLFSPHSPKPLSLYFIYVNSILYGTSTKQITRLQRVQNALARVVVPNRPPGSSSFHLLKQLHWLPVKWRIKFKIATLTFKALETGQPPYLVQQLCAYTPTRALRSSTSKLLQVPRTNLRFGSRSFCASTPTLWNSLPRSVRFCESLTTFRKHLKKFYFQSAFSGAP